MKKYKDPLWYDNRALSWPWGPLTLRMCAFQPHLLMSHPHRDALLHPRILSPRNALPPLSLGTDFLAANHSHALPRPHGFWGSLLKEF